MNKRNITLLAVLVLLAIGAAVYHYTRSSDAVPAPGRTQQFNGLCLACDEYVDATTTIEEGQPAVCPKCGERAVYATFVCPNCGIRFVPALQPRAGGGLPIPPVVPTCPKCGSASVMGYLPIDPDHEKAARGPKPDWPPK